MYNQPRPLRPAKPWQAVNYLKSSREDLGFDAARWNDREPTNFADAGLPAHSTGFDADRYEPMTEPLTPQAIKALALLDDEHRNENFAEQKEGSQDGSSTSAHLPFVLDVYGPIGAKPGNVKLGELDAAETLPRPHDDASQTRDASQDDDLAFDVDAQDLAPTDSGDETASQALQADALTQDLAAPDEEATHTDTPEALSAAEAQEAQADERAVAQAVTETDAALDLDGLDAASDSQTEPEAAHEAEPVPVHVGVAPEEVAQREAEQFERGLAQGLEQGALQAREAMAQELADQCALLAKVTQEVQALVADPKQFFEPLKRLSLHLAEQLVLGELSASSKTIERLVQHCLDEVSHPLQEGVVVELNPEDKKRLQAQGGDFLEGLRLEAVAELKPGSVRVFANDMVVEDLVEHRLHALARGLLSDVPSWQNKSALVKPEPSKHITEHDDDLA